MPFLLNRLCKLSLYVVYSLKAEKKLLDPSVVFCNYTSIKLIFRIYYIKLDVSVWSNMRFKNISNKIYSQMKHVQF